MSKQKCRICDGTGKVKLLKSWFPKMPGMLSVAGFLASDEGKAALRRAVEWPRYPDGTPIPLANLQPEERDALFGKNHVERTTTRV